MKQLIECVPNFSEGCDMQVIKTITDEIEKINVIDTIESSGKAIIAIAFYQMNHFAGNMLQVFNQEGQPFLVMSSQAFESLTSQQIARIRSYQPIIHDSISIIEANGGGSVRCMMAKVFLPIKPLVE